MKTKLFTKARIIIATLVLLTVGLVTGIAETTGPTSGCPEETGGYASKGIRVRKPCMSVVTESGYWWYIKGEVKWVGSVFAGMKGSFEKASKTTKLEGHEYTCTGDDKVCWVCNCYYPAVSAVIQ